MHKLLSLSPARIGVYVIALMTTVHYAMNLEAYCTSYAVAIGVLYGLTLIALTEFATSRESVYAASLVVGVVAVKVAIIAFFFNFDRGDESQIWEFAGSAHTLYQESPIVYTVLHDALALFLVATLKFFEGWLTPKSSQL